MNALVEDQLSRLRRALDSPGARDWMTANRAGNRIYVGRYTALTPVPGHEHRQPNRQGRQAPDSRRIERLAAALRAADQAAQIAEQYSAEPGREDVRYFFPRIDGAEMRSRWDMQDTPPDILITNFSMLSIMLMRDADSGIFDRTRRWLAQDGSVFHLIVDELHLHRGTSGSEIAYLLKLLLNRLGLQPGHPKLKILASSASLEPDDPDSLCFLSEFFGQHWRPEQVVPGYAAALPPAVPGRLDPGPFAELGRALDAADSATELDRAAAAVAAALGCEPAAVPHQARLAAAVDASAEQLAQRLTAACVQDGEVRAVPLGAFAANLFGSDPAAVAAARGLLYARGVADGPGAATVLPAFRLHWFFRNVEGLWACTHPGCGQEPAPAEGRTAGRLFLDSRILCDAATARHRVLELLYCEQCGTTLFGGSRLPLADGAGWELLTADPDIEGIPDRQAARFVERRTYAEFALFWPIGGTSLHADAASWRQSGLVRGQGYAARWTPATLDPHSGRVELGGGGESAVPGYLYLLGADAQPNLVGALPSVCPSCGENYARRLYRKSPIRGFRTGFSKLTQLLSKELFYLIPGHPPGSRKLVLFSDSREGAASLANGVERSHYLDLVREALYDELAKLAIGEPQLLADLEAHGEPRRLPAAWFAATHPDAQERLARLIRASTSPIPGLDDPEMVALLRQRQAAAEADLAELRQRADTRTVPLRLLFEGPDGDPTAPGALLLRMKALGVNPGGPEVLYQDYRYDGFWHRWTDFFDFSDPGAGWRGCLSADGRERKERLRARVVSEICGILFAGSTSDSSRPVWDTPASTSLRTVWPG